MDARAATLSYQAALQQATRQNLSSKMRWFEVWTRCRERPRLLTYHVRARREDERGGSATREDEEGG
eukprot:6368197-Pyramimonas_sp.AAC.1